MAGPTEQCGLLHDVLASIPASNGLRDGSDFGLIPDIECEVDCRVGLSRVGFVEKLFVE